MSASLVGSEMCIRDRFRSMVRRPPSSLTRQAHQTPTGIGKLMHFQRRSWLSFTLRGSGTHSVA
eukprot:4256933-Alexandrium_andersonii.AAC.1